MRLNKYITAILLASSGLLFAANHIVGGANNEKKTDKEKRNLGESFYSGLQMVKSSVYPAMRLEGAPDGVPYGLRCQSVNDKKVALSWNTPEATDGYFEDFENHDDFAVNSAGSIGWSYIDGDNKNTYSWSATNFKNQGQKMAFIIMNPSATEPSVEGNPNYVPTSGKKMLVTMCSIGAQNNDWIISPELNFSEDFKFSFNARSYRTDGISPERMRVGYSTGGKSQSSFTFITPTPYQELPAEWKLYEYTIPKEAKYVCINCVSDDAFMMLIDDIYIGTNVVRPGIMPNTPAARIQESDASQGKGNKVAGRHLVGFNVYRDGKKANMDLVTEIRYTDTADTYGPHDYTVTAVYSDGTESAQSQSLTVDVADPAIIPFEEDFDNWYMDPAKWSTPDNPAGVESYWSIDYYTYGLVDPCATYGYNALQNFDQSLVSRSLRTLDKSNTYLRFETRLEVWKIYPEETCYLAVEISNDNGKTWETIDTYNNRNGEEYWTVRLYPLKDYIKSDYFKLRWRCYGPTAMHIDYWYVDDIKVWNASFGQLRMNVSGADGAVKDTEVKLTGTNGSKYSATTDANGNIALGQVEADHYTVDIVKEGYNVYRGSLDVYKDKTTETSVHLTRPVVTLSSDNISADLSVEEKATKSFTIQNTGDGPMTWRMNYAPKKQSGKGTDLIVNKAWKGSGDLQTSIAFDGEYYYTTSWYYLGEFWKYDKEGNLIEQFRIPDMYYKLYDLAYDGRYFYGSDYSNRLFQLDFENKRIVGTIELTSAPEMKITHVAYNPNNDRFYVGSWNTLCEVRRNGRTSSMAAAFDPDEGHYIYGSAYDNVTPGGPYLWLAAEENYNGYMLDQVVIYQYDLNTKKFTGVKKCVTDVPGYVYGSPMRGVNYICGLEGTVDAKTGKFTLVGALQQSPSLFFEYNVAETDQWLDYSPKKSTLQPGESATIDVTFDARDAEVGQTYTSVVPILTIPELPEKNVTISFTASKQSATPRPRNLSVKEGDATDRVVLSWDKPSVTPDSYNIFRNSKKIANVKDITYNDNDLVRGTYKYEVSAVYGNTESILSDSVMYDVKIGAPYYAPIELTADLALNKNVTLQWKSPLTYASLSSTVGWGSGLHADQVGITSGGTFYAGSLWTADNLTPYRNKKITSASIRIVNPVNYVALCVFKDGERILRKEVTDPITYGVWTTVALDEPIVILPGSEYMIAFQIDHVEGMQPVGIDAEETIEGKGNLLSVDGSYWIPSTQMAIDGNFNIRFDVEPTAISEAAPVAYNIYRNDEKIATVAEEKYIDVLTEGGKYAYTVTSVYKPTSSNDAPESLPSAEATVEVQSIGERMAPNALASEVECNRNVTLGWGFPVAETSTFPVQILPKVTTNIPDYPTYVNSFLCKASEMAIASDGKYIYTSVYTEDGRVNKYDINGKFLEHFYITGLKGIRNITYDGEYFWIADANTDMSYTAIYKVDMDKHIVLEQNNISEIARHITYIPELDNGKGGFEVGDWESSIYVTRRGAKLGDGPRYKGAAGTAYHEGKLYAFEQGNANAHTIGIYDYETCKRIGEIDLENYTGLNETLSSVAGGMSVVRTPDGLTLLALMAQNTQSASEAIFLDLGSVKGAVGYNVYRNGKKLNTEVLTQRVFRETISEEGTYDYQVETVYVDGTTSHLSKKETVTIVPTGTADAPTDLQAVPTTYGYDVALSFADPQLGNGVSFQDFESQQQGQPVNINGWTNTDNGWKTTDHHYHGSLAAMAERDASADIIIPAGGNAWMQFFARANDGIDGKVSVYTSTAGTNPTDFILLGDYDLTQAWKEISENLPEGINYISIRHDAGNPVIIDAISLNATPVAPRVWGYDIFRDGKKLNDAPVRAVSFIDHNLTPGVYSYQVRQQSVTAAMSPLSDAVKLNLNYSNGGQAPEFLRVLDYSSNGVNLAWNAPALGDAVNLKWHTGNSYDAAGLPNGGSFYAGVRWAAQDLVDYAHLSLSEIEVYINQIPDALFVLVYQGNNLVRRQYVQTLRQYSFNTIKLDDPLHIDPTKELRVVIYVEHNEITVPLGYDEGPARTGFGNLYSTDGVTYTTMDNDNTGIYGNWNISIGLRPYATSLAKAKFLPVEDKATSARMFPMTMALSENSRDNISLNTQKAGQRIASDLNTFEGYNVYANNHIVNDKPMFATTYYDSNNYSNYPYVQYKVSAMYSQLGEVFSNVVVIATEGIEETNVASFTVETSDGRIVLRNATPGKHYSISNAAGQLLVSGTVISHDMQLSNPLPSGIYIVKVGSESLKISM